MSNVSLGDMALNFLLQRQNTQIKTNLQQLSTEMTTGVTADLGKTLSGNFSPLAGLEQSIWTLGAYSTATSQASLSAATMQSALTQINDQATSLATSLVGAGIAGQAVQVSALGAQAHAALASALSALNVRAGGQSVFAGAATDKPAVASVDAIMAGVSAAIAGQTSATAIANAITDWFNSPTGFQSVGYLGSTAPMSPVPISNGETASLSTTAADPAIVNTLKGLAMAAVLANGTVVNTNEQVSLMNIAGQSLMNSGTDRVNLATSIGVVQAQIDTATTKNSAEISSLQVARSGLIAADPYATATALQAAQNQLDTLYSVTARISSLSLTNYLK
ncbi:MAG: flagellar biosynthesis protein FlgL [Paracoccaceae bacterium]|nr:flagellar biosynthesis protein FlgL [Paracoccaceae bacterium]